MRLDMNILQLNPRFAVVFFFDNQRLTRKIVVFSTRQAAFLSMIPLLRAFELSTLAKTGSNSHYEKLN